MKITENYLKMLIKQQIRSMQEDNTDGPGDPDPTLWDSAAEMMFAAIKEMVKAYDHTGRSLDEVADEIRGLVDSRLKGLVRNAEYQAGLSEAEFYGEIPGGHGRQLTGTEEEKE